MQKHHAPTCLRNTGSCQRNAKQTLLSELLAAITTTHASFLPLFALTKDNGQGSALAFPPLTKRGPPPQLWNWEPTRSMCSLCAKVFRVLTCSQKSLMDVLIGKRGDQSYRNRADFTFVPLLYWKPKQRTISNSLTIKHSRCGG